MIVTLNSMAIIGINAKPIQVEVDLSSGLPGFSVVGLPDASIRESIDRVKSAIKNSGLVFPRKKITVNLSPADMRKEGSGYDLPIAVGILAAAGLVQGFQSEGVYMVGELSLDGSLRAVTGVLPMVLSKHIYKNSDNTMIIPSANALECSIVNSSNIYAFKHLREVVDYFHNKDQYTPIEVKEEAHLAKAAADIDFQDVKGQQSVKRGLEVAAAGGHNVLMIGPPGSGKTMLAERIATIMPLMSLNESVETTTIYSVAGLTNKNAPMISKRPFRSPHHTISDVALVGGGKIPRPGEVSLATNGILFLDELPEFKKNVLEVLRQPLESRRVSIARANASITYPSKFVLIAAMNPCPCGYYSDSIKQCHCSVLQMQRYLAKISGPLLDRIDIHLEVPAVGKNELERNIPSDSSAVIRQRVMEARNIQTARYHRKSYGCNEELPAKDIKKFCPLTEEAKSILSSAIDDLGLSARAYDKVLKLGRTIADLDSADDIDEQHIAEAISYRTLDKSVWGT